MATIYVKKDGSGNHTNIQPAIYQAVNGDIIDIGAGVFNENVELMGKSLTIQGAGKDITVIQGKFANDVVSGCSFFGGESVITVPSTSALMVGKFVTGTSVTSNSRISSILSPTTIQVSIATATTGNITKTGVTWASGSSTITLPSTTAVVVGMKVEGAGVNALVTAYNTTTRVVTISSPTTASGSAATLLFRKSNNGIAVTQISSPSSSSGPGSIMITGSSDGLVIKNLTAIGFDGYVGQEAAALFFTAGTAPGHSNFLVENCRFTANGDSAVMCGSNPYLSNGTFQNCIIDGKTFTGSEPADVPSFSTHVTQGVIQSIGASSSVIRFSDMRGIIVGRTFTCASAFAGSATISAISGSDVTFNKIATFNVGSTLDCTFTLTAYVVPNCARNLFYIGQNSSPNNTSNITFKNNVVNGQTGAKIAATGSVNMFNSAVTIESVGGLVENNLIDGNFGAGVNSLLSNFAIRCRQANIVVQNNTNIVSGGRKNSEYLVALGTSTNNVTIDTALVEPTQTASGQSVSIKMDKDTLKSNTKVLSNVGFSNEANWRMVSFIFKHTGSSKRLATGFKNLSSIRLMKLKNGMLSGQKYELIKVIISKADRSILTINRNEIDNVSGFDITLL
jgi:hypothetical protein